MIGKTIAKFRKKRGLTQEDLAGLSEIDRTYLSRLEAGKLNISILKFIRLAREIGIEPGELLTECIRFKEENETICPICKGDLEYSGEGSWTCPSCSGFF